MASTPNDAPPAHTNGKVVVFSAPSGAGKTTIVHKVIKQLPVLTFSISATTRPQRDYEVHGKDYYFLDLEEFEAKKEAGELVEWEEVYPGRFYGTLQAEVERIHALGKTPVFEVDVNGGLHLKQLFGQQALALFILPPSVEVLRKRLLYRASEDANEIEVRLARAQEELQQARHFDAQIVNDVLEEAAEEARKAIVEFLETE